VLEAGLTHDGDPTLARHVANAAAKETNSGVVIAKADHGRHSTPTASVIAYGRAMWHAERAPVPFLEVIVPE